MVAAAVAEKPSQVKLPPSERDWEIYKAVAFASQSTRQAAIKFHISQTRVRQVTARVVEFLHESVPAELPEQTPDQRLYVAQLLAREQLNHLYGEAIRMWDKSNNNGRELGQMRYLSMATRISIALSRMPMRPMPEFRIDEEEQKKEDAFDRALGHMCDLLKQAEQQGQAAPPDGDCSEDAVSSGTKEAREAEDFAATADEEGTSDDNPDDDWVELPPNVTPAQAMAKFDASMLRRSWGEEGGEGGERGGASGMEVPRQSLGTSGVEEVVAAEPLNRKERKKRERLLQRALAKRKAK